ncbi:MAG: hypothetical protein AAGC67_05750 [Myxococcota bacterium]
MDSSDAKLFELGFIVLLLGAFWWREMRDIRQSQNQQGEDD